MSEMWRGVCFLLWIVSLGECKIPEFQVTCMFSKDCVLPCMFTPTPNVLIRWYKQETLIHSFPSSKDQSDDSRKVALFKDQVAHGNASLLLQRIVTTDRGRYSCQVNSTEKSDGSIVIVKVEAPITDVHIRLTPDQQILCQTKGVYPVPSLHWETDPPTSASLLRGSTRVTPDPSGLYDMTSTLASQQGRVMYICNIRAKYSTQQWTATLKERADVKGESGRGLLVPCVFLKPHQDFTISWSYSHSQSGVPSVLLTFDSRTRRTSGPGEGRVELDQKQVLLGNGSLHLLSPEGGNTGSYMCTFSTLQTRHLLQTWVNITGPRTATITGKKGSNLWVVAVVIAVLALLVVAVVICKRRGARTAQKDNETQDAEMQPMQTAKPSSEHTVEGSHLTEKTDTYTDRG